jgi:hypothetical protein
MSNALFKETITHSEAIFCAITGHDSCRPRQTDLEWPAMKGRTHGGRDFE